MSLRCLRNVSSRWYHKRQMLLMDKQCFRILLIQVYLGSFGHIIALDCDSVSYGRSFRSAKPGRDNFVTQTLKPTPELPSNTYYLLSLGIEAGVSKRTWICPRRRFIATLLDERLHRRANLVWPVALPKISFDSIVPIPTTDGWQTISDWTPLHRAAWNHDSATVNHSQSEVALMSRIRKAGPRCISHV